MQIYSKTDIGLRRTSNQDAYRTGTLPGGAVWAVVCDGMGGVQGGSVASEIAVEVISDCIEASYHSGMKENSIRTLLQAALTTANIQVYDRAGKDPDLLGMGTTVVAVLVAGGVAHIAHAGDSRLYIARPDHLEQITKDHSMVQSMVEQGQLTPHDAQYHPRKNVITRALGVNETIEIDFNEYKLLAQDVMLLCTDGLTNYTTPQQMLEALFDGGLAGAPDRLIAAANSGGGGDNITVVLLAADAGTKFEAE